MSNAAVRLISGQGMPLRGNDIDTDRIIPARFLRSVSFDGLGEQVFADDRQQTRHPFDLPQYQTAKVLIVNHNFGCGSSREHAPQAIRRWGIEAIIGESFAEIFFGNCIAIGMPCVTAASADVQRLQTQIEQAPETVLSLDLSAQTLTYEAQLVPVAIADGPRQMFLEGTWDACGQLLQQTSAIRQTASQLPYVSWASPKSN